MQKFRLIYVIVTFITAMGSCLLTFPSCCGGSTEVPTPEKCRDFITHSRRTKWPRIYIDDYCPHPDHVFVEGIPPHIKCICKKDGVE